MSGINVKGKNFVVVGGGTLGEEIVKGLVQHGAARVIVTSRSLEKAEANASKLSEACGAAELGAKIIGAELDVNSEESIRRAANDVPFALEGEPLHGLIITAGGNNKEANMGVITEPFEKAEGVLAVIPPPINVSARANVYQSNVVGPMLCFDLFCEAFLLNQEEGCSVLAIGSVAPNANLSGVQAYAGAKAALKIELFGRAAHYARSRLARSVAPIRVNLLTWGFTDAVQNRGMLMGADGNPTFRGSRVIERTPLRRFGRPDEIIGGVVYLMSDTSSYVTGSELTIDGGFSSCGGV